MIKEAADYGAARHVQLVIDRIWPDWINSTPDELDRLFDGVDYPNFGVNLDPGVLMMIGVDPTEFHQAVRQADFSRPSEGSHHEGARRRLTEVDAGHAWPR